MNRARILIPASRLSAALGLSAPQLRRLCAEVATGNRGDAAYDWTSLRTSLAKRGLDRWRKGLLSVRTSKHWVAGYPRLVREWDVAKNGDLFPFEVPFGSHRYVWWKCPKGPDHEWRASVLNRTRGGTLCPFCQGRSRASRTRWLRSVPTSPRTGTTRPIASVRRRSLADPRGSSVGDVLAVTGGALSSGTARGSMRGDVRNAPSRSEATESRAEVDP